MVAYTYTSAQAGLFGLPKSYLCRVARAGMAAVGGTIPRDNPKERELMTADERIAALKTKTARLMALLDDPQPGLIMWNRMVCEELDSIAEHAPSYVKKE